MSQPGTRRPDCQRTGCGRAATWRPVIFAPSADGAGPLVRIEIPVLVCTRHKFPKYGWKGLADPRFVEATMRRFGDRFALDRAWVGHELLWAADA